MFATAVGLGIGAVGGVSVRMCHQTLPANVKFADTQ